MREEEKTDIINNPNEDSVEMHSGMIQNLS